MSKLIRQQGLTLLELLVAVAIMALIGLATTTTLNTTINNEKVVRERAEELEMMGFALTTIRQDLEQMINRSTRSASGISQSTPPLIGHHNAEENQGRLLTFTRTGRRSPPGALPGSRLQRVHYRLEDDELIRMSAPIASPLDEELPNKRYLVSGVHKITLAYLNQTWRKQWSVQQPFNSLPEAIRITLHTERWGEIQQVVMLP